MTHEAEAIAWQTNVPHLIFPTLAMERVQAVSNWSERQRLVRRQNHVLVLTAWHSRHAAPFEEWYRALFPDVEQNEQLAAWERIIDEQTGENGGAVPAFADVLAFGTVAQKQTLLSDGISKAMNNTAFALSIAVLCIVFHLILTSYAKAMVESVELNGLKLENLLSRRHATDTQVDGESRAA